MSKKQQVIVPSEIVRNELFHLDNGTFLVYARLCFLWFQNYKDPIIKMDFKKFMINLYITDTRTLKKRLNKLYDAGLIKTKIDKLPKRGTIEIHFVENPIESKHFTMLPATVFNYLGRIDEHCFRLLFYYKSFINRGEGKTFCYAGFDKITKDLRMGNTTLDNSNDLLKKYKLLKIEKHQLTHTYDYGINDELIYDRYNNHYYILESNM